MTERERQHIVDMAKGMTQPEATRLCAEIVAGCDLDLDAVDKVYGEIIGAAVEAEQIRETQPEEGR